MLAEVGYLSLVRIVLTLNTSTIIIYVPNPPALTPQQLFAAAAVAASPSTQHFSSPKCPNNHQMTTETRFVVGMTWLVCCFFLIASASWDGQN